MRAYRKEPSMIAILIGDIPHDERHLVPFQPPKTRRRRRKKRKSRKLKQATRPVRDDRPSSCTDRQG